MGMEMIIKCLKSDRYKYTPSKLVGEKPCHKWNVSLRAILLKSVWTGMGDTHINKPEFTKNLAPSSLLYPKH